MSMSLAPPPPCDCDCCPAPLLPPMKDDICDKHVERGVSSGGRTEEKVGEDVPWTGSSSVCCEKGLDQQSVNRGDTVEKDVPS